MDPLAVMWLGSSLLTLDALAVAVVVHLVGLGRIPPTGALGLPGKRLRTDASTYAGTHRAAAPLTWLTSAVAATAAVGALAVGLQAGIEEWAVLAVLSAIVLVVGLTLATWRARTALEDDALRGERPPRDAPEG